MYFIVRLLLNAAALWVAVSIVPGVEYTGSVLPFLGVALVFGILNAIVRPILLMLSLPIVMLTLGLFTLVVNALLLWLTAAVSGALGIDFRVLGFIPAFLGALVVTIVSIILTLFVGHRPNRRSDSDRHVHG
jgi:putative membrane protein